MDRGSFRATWSSRGTVLLPREARAIPGGVWLHGATSNRALAAQAVTGWLASVNLGFVPGRNLDWAPPVAAEAFDRWLVGVQERSDHPIRWWVAQLPADRRRRRFNLLLLDDQRAPTAFAKLTTNPPNPLAVTAMLSFRNDPPKTFWAPGLVLHGELDQYSYVVTTAMPNEPHRPATLAPTARRQIVAEIQARLDPHVQAGSVGVHGDFGPWNVRRLRHGQVAVVDWEETTQGVLAADELWHATCIHASRMSTHKAVERVRAELSHHTEADIAAAAAFWNHRLGGPQPVEVDQSVAMPVNLEATGTRIKAVVEALLEQGGLP